MDQSVLPRFPSAAYDVVLLAASAGGVGAAGHLLSQLPPDFPAPLVLVQHVGQQTLLVEVLQRRTSLRVQWAERGGRLQAAHVYVAPPDRHLRIAAPGTCVLDSSPAVHSLRPCADITFSSAAKVFGHRALGVILTGYGTDGARGVRAIADAGGAVLVQDPSTSEAPGMPMSAIATSVQHVVLPVEVLAPAIVSLVAVEGAAQLFGLRHTIEHPFPPLPVRKRSAA